MKIVDTPFPFPYAQAVLARLLPPLSPCPPVPLPALRIGLTSWSRGDACASCGQAAPGWGAVFWKFRRLASIALKCTTHGSRQPCVVQFSSVMPRALEANRQNIFHETSKSGDHGWRALWMLAGGRHAVHNTGSNRDLRDH